MSEQSDQTNQKPFFVGYLPIPGERKRSSWLIGGSLAIVALTFGVLLSLGQTTASKGTWVISETRVVEGLMSLDPYPVIHTGEQSVLLVRPGKSSAEDLVAPYAGQFVRVSAIPIERGGWLMLEVGSDTQIEAIDAIDGVSKPAIVAGKEVAMSGEIVDSKCFLGVMKPGAGKVHRACAAMCLTGGMPPMLVVTDDAGDRFGYMLVGDAGESVSKRLVPDVAVPVTVSGRLQTRGDLTYLEIGDGAITRL